MDTFTRKTFVKHKSMGLLYLTRDIHNTYAIFVYSEHAQYIHVSVQCTKDLRTVCKKSDKIIHFAERQVSPLLQIYTVFGVMNNCISRHALKSTENQQKYVLNT